MAMRDLATLPFRSIARPRWYDPLGYAAALLGVATATGIMWLARSILSLGSIYLVYMVVVMAVAVGWGLGQSIVASAAAVLATNFFFIQPIFTFTVAAFQDALALAIFLALATLTSQLVARLRREASDARRGELIESTLYVLSETINRQHNLGALLDAVAGQLRLVLGLSACDIELDERGGLGVVSARSAEAAGVDVEGDEGQESAPATVVRVPLTRGDRATGTLLLTLPAHKKHLGEEESRLVNSFVESLQTAIERARLQQTAVQTEVLRRTDELRVAMLSAVAHDLRTPLTSIKTAATSLLNPKMAWDEEDSQAFLRAISGETDHINRIVSNLLDVSRIEEGRMRPEKKPHHIGAVIDNVLQRLQQRLDEHPVDTRIEPGLPQVPMDEVEIDEALTNLLENCLKYTPPATPIHISARRRANMLEVEVADEGAGIPPAQLPQLFDRFYRVRADRQTKGVHGLGLGLSIVKGIVEAHGGKVSATNRPGGGACFTFTLPIPQPVSKDLTAQMGVPTND
jgi:two-component system sensor histidine kinase KdpD